MVDNADEKKQLLAFSFYFPLANEFIEWCD